MLLHFIFVIKESDLGKRTKEFEYIKQMAHFYKIWIKQIFSKDFEIQCDEMTTKPGGLLRKLDTHHLLHDHRERGEDIYHFYLCHFRPIWTDCTCEGYSAENFGMVLWQTPKNEDDIMFLAEKNCTVVSHEIAHELLRQANHKRYMEIIHEIWEKHHFANLAFEAYDKDFKKTEDNPYFLTIDTSEFISN